MGLSNDSGPRANSGRGGCWAPASGTFGWKRRREMGPPVSCAFRVAGLSLSKLNMPWTNWPNPNFESWLTRREALRRVACGFGYLAFAGMSASAANAVGKLAHFRPKAKRVIFIFMQGGPSHVDTFDYKRALFEND